jgi:glycosyltransferase involved in cell wall biosynthesis
LVENFPYGRYRLKLLFDKKPDRDYWGIDWREHPCEVVFLDNSSGSHGSGVSAEKAEVWKLLRWGWRSVGPSEAKLAAGLGREVVRLSKVFRQHPGDVIHLFRPGPDLTAIAARLGCHGRIVVSYLGSPSSDPESLRPVNRSVELLSFACCDVRIVKTEAAGRAWARRLHAGVQSFRVVHNGVDLDEFRPALAPDALRRLLEVPEGAVIVGISARLDAMKGHTYLLDAAAEVRKRLPNAVFLVVGDGPLQGGLEKQAERLGLAGTVRFLGYRNDVNSLTWLYDIAALPSAAEGCPWGVLEAMACGKPVVASAIEPIAEVVVDGCTGMLTPVGDAPALAKAIMKLLEDRDLRLRMGHAGWQRLQEHFTSKKMLDETFGVYDRLLRVRR